MSFPGFVLAMEVVTGGGYLFNAALGNAPGEPLRIFNFALRPALSLFWLVALARAGRSFPAPVLRSPALLYAASSWIVGSLFAINPLKSWNFLMELSRWRC